MAVRMCADRAFHGNQEHGVDFGVNEISPVNRQRVTRKFRLKHRANEMHTASQESAMTNAVREHGQLPPQMNAMNAPVEMIILLVMIPAVDRSIIKDVRMCVVCVFHGNQEHRVGFGVNEI